MALRGGQTKGNLALVPGFKVIEIVSALSQLRHGNTRFQDGRQPVARALSFLAIALGYDAVSGEREQGTLRQVLVNPVPRGTLLIGKLLGGGLSLWAPFAVAYALAVVIMASNPHVHLMEGLGDLECDGLSQTILLRDLLRSLSR